MGCEEFGCSLSVELEMLGFLFFKVFFRLVFDIYFWKPSPASNIIICYYIWWRE